MPEFSDRIIFEPVFELIGFETAVRRLTLMGLGRDDLGRLETVQEGLRLRCHDDLRPQRHGAHQAGDDLESVGMKTEFRLIKNDDIRKIVLRLKKERQDRHSPERAVRNLMRTEQVVRSPLSPVEDNLGRVEAAWFEVKVMEFRHDLSDCRNNSVIHQVIPRAVRVEERGQIARVWSEPPILVDVAEQPDPC